MDIISKSRGEGKTSSLIRMSSRTGIPIIYCGQNGEYILRLAAQLGYTIPNPIHVSMVKNAEFSSFYVDDADCVLAQLLGVDISAMSITKQSHQEE